MLRSHRLLVRSGALGSFPSSSVTGRSARLVRCIPTLQSSFPPRRAYSQKSNYQSSSTGANVAGGFAVGAVFAGAMLYGLTQTGFVSNEAPPKIKSTEPSPECETVIVDKDLPPFPVELPKSESFATDFVLLATGMRAVSFLKFKVYGLGIYVAKEDLPKVHKVLHDSNFISNFLDMEKYKTHSKALEAALRDNKTSQIIVSNLVDAGVRFTLRIVPTRNTDFGHLRNGFFNSVLANPLTAEYGNDPDFRDGLQELKDAFELRGSFDKHKVLLVQRMSEKEGGRIEFSFHNSRYEANSPVQYNGSVKNPLVVKIVFLNYLAGPRPSSAQARENAIKGLVKIAEDVSYES